MTKTLRECRIKYNYVTCILLICLLFRNVFEIRNQEIVKFNGHNYKQTCFSRYLNLLNLLIHVVKRHARGTGTLTDTWVS